VYALCAGYGAGADRLWWSQRESEKARAKAICAQCPLALACKAVAVRLDEATGIWGRGHGRRGCAPDNTGGCALP